MINGWVRREMLATVFFFPNRLVQRKLDHLSSLYQASDSHTALGGLVEMNLYWLDTNSTHILRLVSVYIAAWAQNGTQQLEINSNVTLGTMRTNQPEH